MLKFLVFNEKFSNVKLVEDSSKDYEWNALIAAPTFLNWNKNRLLSEELILNKERAKKHLTMPGFEKLISRSLTRSTTHSAIRPFLLPFCNRFYISNQRYFGMRAIEITQKWRMKAWKSHLRSQRLLPRAIINFT